MRGIILALLISVITFGCGKEETETAADQNLEPKEFPSSIDGTVNYQGNQREYKLHIPPSYDALSEVPLVIVLHGGGGTAHNVQNFTEMNPVSDLFGFITAYPQGFGPTGEGYSWADGRGTSADNLGVDDVGFIEQLTTELISDYEIDNNRIYICGFSNGGFMTQKLACESEIKFAAMASLGSTIAVDQLNNCAPERAIPMLFIFGDADPLVPYDGGPVAENPTPVAGIEAALNFWKTNNDCTTESILTDLPDIVINDNSAAQVQTFTECECNASVKFLKLINGGHTWPGVELTFIEPTLGDTNEDIEASVELWEFFKNHKLCN